MPKIWQFASYNLLSLFSPPVGLEHLHCHMKRGFKKARKREPQVKELLEQDNIYQEIGKLAQRGVWEFHRQPEFLQSEDGVEQIAKILELSQKNTKVRERVQKVLENYRAKPILAGKNILQLNSGNEGFPKPILIEQGNYRFNLYAAIDCLFEELNGTLHILDFKTGKSDFDNRQAYIYLLAASYLYPQQEAVASFYNLETCKWSEPLSGSDSILKAFQIELAQKAKQHQKDLWHYRQNSSQFREIFPPNPGASCKYCPFNSICEFSSSEVAT